MKTFKEFLNEMSLGAYKTSFTKDNPEEETYGDKPAKGGTRPDLGSQVKTTKIGDDKEYVYTGVPISGYFSKKDKIIVSHPRTAKILEQKLSKSDYRINILFIEANDQRISSYESEVEEFIKQQNIQTKGSITFVKNGTSGHVLTPWMILHTLGHAVTTYAGGASRSIKNILNDLTRMIYLIGGEPCQPKLRGEALVFLWGADRRCRKILGEVFAFKSASAPTDGYKSYLSNEEFVHELIAEYLWNGDKIRIKPEYSNDPEVTKIVKSISLEISELLNSCLGHIIYDQYW